MTILLQPQIICSICDEPVDLYSSKTDAAGKAVHEECYVLRQALKQFTQPTNLPTAF